MFNKLLIIGCGLIGSSVLRAVSNKKLSKKIFVYEKSKKNISKINSMSIETDSIYMGDNIKKIALAKRCLEILEGMSV